MVDGKRVSAGEPIESYFPSIVERDLFHQVQAGLARNAALPGRGGGANGSISNVFGHLARCARCGSTMAHVNKGSGSKGGTYLQCDMARRGLGCDRTPLRYDRLEPLLLHLTKGLDPADLLTDEAAKAREQARLTQRRQAIEGELGQLTKEVDSYLESIGRAEGAMKHALESKLAEKLVRRAELEQELTSLHCKQVHTAEAIAEHLQSVEDLITRMGQLSGAERGDLRRRLRHALHQLIDRIDLAPGPRDSEIRLSFKDSGTLLLVLDDKGALRLADDGTKLYWFDEQGHIDVDPIDDPSTEAERHARQRQANAKVAEALRKHRLNPQMTAC
jgi:ElaB/YqjD/DUF883 family membrane-anchored ribosome-binding protein